MFNSKLVSFYKLILLMPFLRVVWFSLRPILLSLANKRNETDHRWRRPCPASLGTSHLAKWWFCQLDTMYYHLGVETLPRKWLRGLFLIRLTEVTYPGCGENTPQFGMDEKERGAERGHVCIQSLPSAPDWGWNVTRCFKSLPWLPQSAGL